MSTQFASLLLLWYAQNGRDLPWRQTRDAYRIWVSEIVLQQTRVEQGRAYYERFIRRFPTVEALAQATEDEVLHEWQGLGYYSRARNMRLAAQQVVGMGGFPRDYRGLLALRGVGEYTAAAIASAAYDEPCAVVDGNVYRVLSRYMDEPTPIDSTQGKKLFSTLAQEMMDTTHPATYNQAIMDFGATHCTPQSPQCDTCPLADSCLALANHTIQERPVKQHRTRVTDRYLTYLFTTDAQGRILLQRREGDDIWHGLYQFPLIESEQPLTLPQLHERFPQCQLTCVAQDQKHQLSHQRLHADFYRCTIFSADAPFPGVWVTPSALDQYALPRLLTRMLERFMEG